MHRKSLRVLLPVLLLTPAAMTLAQDAPPAPPAPKPPVVRPLPKLQKSPPLTTSQGLASLWSQAPRRLRVRTIKPQLGDLDARQAAVDAEAVRLRAGCLMVAADRVDKAAKHLDALSKAKRAVSHKERDDAQDAVNDALDLADECEQGPEQETVDDPPEARSAVSGASVSGACAPDRTGCDAAFGNRAWSNAVGEYQADLQSCYEDGLFRKADLRGVTRYMVRVGTGNNTGVVERLRVEKDTVNDEAVLQCQADIIRGIEVPEAADGRTLRFTVSNSPVQRKP